MSSIDENITGYSQISHEDDNNHVKVETLLPSKCTVLNATDSEFVYDQLINFRNNVELCSQDDSVPDMYTNQSKEMFSDKVADLKDEILGESLDPFDAICDGDVLNSCSNWMHSSKLELQFDQSDFYSENFYPTSQNQRTGQIHNYSNSQSGDPLMHSSDKITFNCESSLEAWMRDLDHDETHSFAKDFEVTDECGSFSDILFDNEFPNNFFQETERHNNPATFPNSEYSHIKDNGNTSELVNLENNLTKIFGCDNLLNLNKHRPDEILHGNDHFQKPLCSFSSSEQLDKNENTLSKSNVLVTSVAPILILAKKAKSLTEPPPSNIACSSSHKPRLLNERINPHNSEKNSQGKSKSQVFVMKTWGNKDGSLELNFDKCQKKGGASQNSSKHKGNEALLKNFKPAFQNKIKAQKSTPKSSTKIQQMIGICQAKQKYSDQSVLPDHFKKNCNSHPESKSKMFECLPETKSAPTSQNVKNDVGKPKHNFSIKVDKKGCVISLPARNVNSLMVKDLLCLSGRKKERSIMEETDEYRKNIHQIVYKKHLRLERNKNC
ncbi:uncharacterized protein LOC131946243 isoform X2 [Physella acuta]|nr:uncharacterized protein LOC131946243 isoform X2 [Physella acuta]XP_059162933.1 uncharacterized protein LOC131946243 isoform X2 [Physella acuta]